MLRRRAQQRDVFRGHLVGEHRQRAFGQDDEAATALRDEIGIDSERFFAIRRLELEILSDIALKQADRRWLTDRMAPIHVGQRVSGRPDDCNCDGARKQPPTMRVDAGNRIGEHCRCQREKETRQ